MSDNDQKNQSGNQRDMLLSKMPEKKIVALTGVMGAGKSSVIRILKDEGIPVLDCDEINARLIQKGERGYEAVIAAFPFDLKKEDGGLDKKKMSACIFHDAQQKEKLEAILHPMIQEEIDSEIAQLQEPLVVVEVPLLFEIGWEKHFQEIWVVVCSENILLERLQKYRGIALEEAKLRLAHQMKQEEKAKRADVIFYNDGDLDHLKEQIVKQLKGAKAYAQRR